RPPAGHDHVRGHAVARRKLGPQPVRAAVGVAVHVRSGLGRRGERLGRRPERILVGRELDRAGDAELALQLLDGLAREVRTELLDVLGDQGHFFFYILSALGYEPSTLSDAHAAATSAIAAAISSSRW